jgi:hypothetical protein
MSQRSSSMPGKKRSSPSRTPPTVRIRPHLVSAIDASPVFSSPTRWLFD